jgi:hypothetical protein
MRVGNVHQVLQSAARKADVINHEQDLSAIRVGLHDGLFQGTMPVDAQSTCCYLLPAADHREADTWGVLRALAEDPFQVLPMNDELTRSQQKVADRFRALGLVPVDIKVSDIVWPEGV